MVSKRTRCPLLSDSAPQYPPSTSQNFSRTRSISSPPSRTSKDNRAKGATRDPKRKGPSLGPNAGGVSLDRQRLGTTAGKRDKMTYQSRFGVRADTPGPTGNSELFKRPYRLLYLPWRKASCRETKDVPLPKDTRPHSREFAQATHK